MFILTFFLLLLNLPSLMASFIHPRYFWKMKQSEGKDGDLKKGCIFFPTILEWPVDKEYFKKILNIQTPTENYKFALSLAFTMDEVNRNPDLLPNKSLVFEWNEDNCKSVYEWYSAIQLWRYYPNFVPNYICEEDTMCILVLTGPNWETSVTIGSYLELWKFQQVIQLTYGHFHPILSDHEKFPYLYQMAPKHTSLSLAMASVIVHFSWNWVGLVISDDDQGTQFLSYLRRELEKNTVCFAFVNMIPINMQLYISKAELYYNQIKESSTNVVIIYGDSYSTLAVSFQFLASRGLQRIWVITSQWDTTTSKRDFMLDSSHLTLAFAHHHGEISGFKNFVQTMNPIKYTEEYLARLEWMNFNCDASISNCKTLMNDSLNNSMERLVVRTFDMSFSDGIYDIYNAVYALAHTIHAMFLQQVENPTMVNGKGHDSWCLKVNAFLKKTQFTNPVGDRVNLNPKEELQEEYDIFQIWNFPHGLRFKVKIGQYSPYFTHGQQLHVYEDMIELSTGNRQMPPPSVCSADCGPGFRKFWQEGMAVCCFKCSPCPENEISNETNMDQCVKCPDDQYANIEQNQCMQKAVIFLSYEDTLGITLALVALCFSAFTALVLGVFVKYHDTPIMKANNRKLSYILLISLFFCFLCSFLFIGQPNSATCMLQQITFGVVFTVAVSTVLAKTVTVLLAFKITAPGTRMRNFLVSGAPNYIIAISTLIQVTICSVWLVTSPPSVNIDVHSEHGHIIIVCIKGSVTAFYCVLGYLACLAQMSFTVAFLSRNLPNTFNEAKFLTFSMLLFCSVWITFLPVYHSSKGKVMVAVEIFSILASSAGILGCIFVPKCFIILFRPQEKSLQNIKENLPSRTDISLIVTHNYIFTSYKPNTQL
ncbi:LOW QUALITY PROTEIN: vomeronasal type-2 receptor 116 [Cricetulus griseus]|uniref:LOW QUALITY PROTEIN: vomeronasal type-2 receptor 116 n=1 Tax=Cricetulus griseus TaxID=10029 RepID=UPI000F73E038|nr:LOW QUALITY PROTEIN: vomeronasal type-2 receptor 116 [Cricetulus griseus]